MSTTRTPRVPKHRDPSVSISDEELWNALLETFPSTVPVEQAFGDGLRAIVRSLRRGALTNEEADSLLKALLAVYVDSVVNRLIEEYTHKSFDPAALLSSLGEPVHGRA